MQINKLAVLGFILSIFTFGNVSSQTEADQQKDELMMNDGEQKIGRVIETNDSTITFLAQNDTANVVIDKSSITRIAYGNGEIEQLSFGRLSSDAMTWDEKMAKYKNKVAVLPFVYQDHFTKHETDNMSLQTQMDCIKNIQNVNTVLDIQHMDSVNAKLVEHYIHWENIRQYLPAEIADMLEVEFIVYGTVTVTPIGQPNAKEDKFGTENQTLETPQGRREGDTVSPKKFETIVDMNIYNILGETVYTNAHESFWQTPDAYNMNLKHLVDESPFNKQ